jgi:hypothetical protein
MAARDTTNILCEVCGAVISPAQALKIKNLDYRVCPSFDCNRIMNQRAGMSPAMFHSHLEFQRKLLRQNRERQAEHKRRIEETATRQYQQEQAVLDQMLSANFTLDRTSIQTVVIPTGKLAPAPLPDSRIDDYLQHLRNIIDQAAACQSPDDIIQDQHTAAHDKLVNVELSFAANPQLHDISDRLCGLCKGGCCVSGGNHAYLSTITMYRQMQKNPDWSTQQLFDTYRSHIGEHSMEGSCINHTATGCALPRHMRSDICNAFYCDTLKTFQDHNQQQAASQLLVIQRADTYCSWFDPDRENDISRALLLDPVFTRRVDLDNGHIDDIIDDSLD